MRESSNFGEANRSSKVKESYTFSREENNPRLNENFVYKFEENKIYQKDKNNLGQEFNRDAHIKEQQHGTIDVEKITNMTTNAAATTATSVASTVAVAATTAVVVVVGGGLVVYGQTVDKPEIVQFEELYSYENNIVYAISIGNDIEKINSGEEKTECDIILELTCESYEDFSIKKEIKTFGRYEGDFPDLEYETEYTLNLYQNAFLDLESELLMEPVKITTGLKEEPPIDPPEPPIDEPTGNFYFDFETTPFGGMTLYGYADYTGETSHLSEFSIKYKSGNYEDVSDPEWFGETYFADDAFGTRQQLDINLDAYEGTYTFALFAYDSTPSGRYSEDGETGASQVMLFYEEIAIETIPVEIPNANKIYLHRTNGQYENEYTIYVNYINENEYYDNFYVQMMTLEGAMVTSIPMSYGLKEKYTFTFDGKTYSETDKYAFTLWCLSTDPNNASATTGSETSSSGVEKELYTEVIDLFYVDDPYETPEEPPEEIPEPELVLLSFDFRKSYYSQNEVFVTLETTYQEYCSNFYIVMSDVDAGTEYTYVFEPYSYGKDLIHLSGLVNNSDLLGKVFTYRLFCDFTYSDSTSLYEFPSQTMDLSSESESYLSGSLRFYSEPDESSHDGYNYSDRILYAEMLSSSEVSANYSDVQIVYTPVDGEPIIEEVSSPLYPHQCTDFIDDNRMWNVMVRGKASEEDSYTILYSEDIDFSTIDGNEITDHTPPSEITGVNFYFEKSYYNTHHMFISTTYTDEGHNWDDGTFSITFTDANETNTYSSTILALGEKCQLEGITDYSSMLLTRTVYNYVIEMTTSSGKEPIYSNTLDYTSAGNVSETYINGSFQFTSEEEHDMPGSYMILASIHFDDPSIYSDVYMRIHSSDATTGDEINYDTSFEVPDSTYSIDFLNDHGVHLVEIYGRLNEGASQLIYSETIDFADINGNEPTPEPTMPDIMNVGFMVYSSYQNPNTKYATIDIGYTSDTPQEWEPAL